MASSTSGNNGGESGRNTAATSYRFTETVEEAVLYAAESGEIMPSSEMAHPMFVPRPSPSQPVRKDDQQIQQAPLDPRTEEMKQEDEEKAKIMAQEDEERAKIMAQEYLNLIMAQEDEERAKIMAQEYLDLIMAQEDEEKAKIMEQEYLNWPDTPPSSPHT